MSSIFDRRRSALDRLRHVTPPGHIGHPGSEPRRVVVVQRPSHGHRPDGRKVALPRGAVLPVTKGALFGRITHVVTDGRWEGVHVDRHLPGLPAERIGVYLER